MSLSWRNLVAVKKSQPVEDECPQYIQFLNLADKFAASKPPTLTTSELKSPPQNEFCEAQGRVTSVSEINDGAQEEHPMNQPSRTVAPEPASIAHRIPATTQANIAATNKAVNARVLNPLRPRV